MENSENFIDMDSVERSTLYAQQWCLSKITCAYAATTFQKTLLFKIKGDGSHTPKHFQNKRRGYPQQQRGLHFLKLILITVFSLSKYKLGILSKTTVYFRSTKVSFQSTRIRFRSTKVYVRSPKVYFRSTKNPFNVQICPFKEQNRYTLEV